MASRRPRAAVSLPSIGTRILLYTAVLQGDRKYFPRTRPQLKPVAADYAWVTFPAPRDDYVWHLEDSAYWEYFPQQTDMGVHGITAGRGQGVRAGRARLDKVSQAAKQRLVARLEPLVCINGLSPVTSPQLIAQPWWVNLLVLVPLVAYISWRGKRVPYAGKGIMAELTRALRSSPQMTGEKDRTPERPVVGGDLRRLAGRRR